MKTILKKKYYQNVFFHLEQIYIDNMIHVHFLYHNIISINRWNRYYKDLFLEILFLTQNKYYITFVPENFYYTQFGSCWNKYTVTRGTQVNMVSKTVLSDQDYLQGVTCRSRLRNNSWKPEFVQSFNMGNIIFVKILSRAIASDKMQRK